MQILLKRKFLVYFRLVLLLLLMIQIKSTSDNVSSGVDFADTFLSRIIDDDNVLRVANDD